jgi:hypothetical protein
VTGLPSFTLPAPHGSLIVAGAQRVHVTARPHHQLVGRRVGIHQGAKAPKHGDQFGVWQVAAHHIQKGSYALWHRNGGGLRIPIDRGALVGTARVAACVPILGEDGKRPDGVHSAIWEYEHEGDLPHQQGGLWLIGVLPDAPKCIEDQRPFADFTPGCWALLLDDARPTTAPNGCPACDGSGVTGQRVALTHGGWGIGQTTGPCPTCSGLGSCPPISGVSGRAGCWTWTPEGAT